MLATAPGHCATVVWVGCNLVQLLSAVLFPFLPATSQTFQQQLRLPLCKIPRRFGCALVPGGHLIDRASVGPLFENLTECQVDRLRQECAGEAGAEKSHITAPDPGSGESKEECPGGPGILLTGGAVLVAVPSTRRAELERQWEELQRRASQASPARQNWRCSGRMLPK